MSAQIFCPKCDRSCRIKEELLGRRVRCPACQEIFKAEAVPLAESEPELEELPEFMPSLPAERSRDEEHKRRPQPALDERDRPKKADRDRSDRDEHDRPKKKERDHSDRDEDDRPKKKDRDRPEREERDRPKKAATVVQPGRVDNPFDSASRLALAPAEVDHSVFDFGFGDEEPPPAKKKSDRDRDDEDDDRPRRRKDSPETEHALNGKTKGLNAPSANGKKADVPGVHRSKDGDERSGSGQRNGTDGDAAFFGLQDQGAPAAPGHKKKSRRYFHLRQSGFWDEVRLFRVFLKDESLVFIPAASGKLVPEMEEALQASSLDDYDKKVRNKVLDLKELSVNELVENDPESFRWSVEKITEAAVELPRSSKRGSAGLRIVHRTKGEVVFDLPSKDDVERALEHLPDALGEALAIKIRWSKSRGCFVER